MPINGRWNAAAPIHIRPGEAEVCASSLHTHKGGVTMWKSLKVGAALSGVLFLGIAACNQSPPPSAARKGPSLASQQWEKVTAGFLQNYFNAPPLFPPQTRRPPIHRPPPGLRNHGNRPQTPRLHGQR